MEQITALRAPHCILLAVSLASESNITGLKQLIQRRSDVFDLELSLRIILTFLPESLDPITYTGLLRDLTTGTANIESSLTSIDCGSVQELPTAQAQRRLRKLHLIPLAPPAGLPHDTTDLFSIFLIHRAHKIDYETGLVTTIPSLISPFISTLPYVQRWYISTVLPLIRLEYEYYSPSSTSITLREFEALDGRGAISRLLSKTELAAGDRQSTTESVGRDFRGLITPWIYGSEQRRRRRRKGLSSKTAADADADAVQNWQHVFDWILAASTANFELASQVFQGWDGPSDTDLGGDEDMVSMEGDDHDEKSTQNVLQRAIHGYCRTGLVALYGVTPSKDNIKALFEILAGFRRRFDAEEVDVFDTTSTSASSNPTLPLSGTAVRDLQPEALNRPDNAFTTPTPESFALLHSFLDFSFALAQLGQPLSVLKVARLVYLSEANEQLSVLQNILGSLIDQPSLIKEFRNGWESVRVDILNLHHLPVARDVDLPETGFGIFGKVAGSTVEKEIIKTLCLAGQVSLVERDYFQSAEPSYITLEDLESLIVDMLYHYYDNASNGNRDRGLMKKAYDILNTFKGYFPDSLRFKQCTALLAATHALSYYSLILQQGVPLRPVTIRSYSDPVLLIPKILEQNAKCYTKLDDLVSIGRNFVLAGLGTDDSAGFAAGFFEEDQASLLAHVEHRIIGMVIDAALADGDFETAYSYVVNRLNLSNHSSAAYDDVSWRAAFQAGRYRSTKQFQASNAASSSVVRHLEQRMELLSHALQLAPATALPEILGAWRRCEEELLTLLAQEQEAELDFDDTADHGGKTRVVPGGFSTFDQVPQIQPKRKQIGRGGAAEEAPMGLFDVAKGAAAAFSKSAGAYRSSQSRVTSSSSQKSGHDGQSAVLGGGADGSERVRKRDMVASAMTSGLASGIGWVLGATPVQQHEEE